MLSRVAAEFPSVMSSLCARHFGHREAFAHHLAAYEGGQLIGTVEVR